MQYFIDLTKSQYETLWAHLLPDEASVESAAFIFADFEASNGSKVLTARDVFLVPKSGFQLQFDDYIELSDETRISIIKKAHHSKTALVELHSHPFDSPWAAAFSLADIAGFEETVPHMWWRLPGRPYAAIVAAPNGFDALIWSKDPHTPEFVTALRVDGRTLTPTGKTMRGHHAINQ